MDENDVAYLGLCQVATAIARGEVTSSHVTRKLLDRIRRLDGSLNSFIVVLARDALEAAEQADRIRGTGQPTGPLHGVPIGLKDLFHLAGTRTTFASAAFADFLPDHDATVVERLKAAGAIIIGKLNLHEAASGTSGLVSHYGPVRNPWNTAYITGGSSSGSAAALAAGLVYGALGSDTAMSIRQPAAYCGVVGLKPTYGRVSKHGALALSWSLDHAGPMARRVEDVALLLDVLAGFDPRDPASAQVAVPDYKLALGSGIADLRIGVPREHFFEDVESSTLRVVEEAIQVLVDLGAQVQTCTLPLAGDAMQAGRLILRAEAAAYHAARFRTVPDLLSASLRDMIDSGSQYSAVDYLQAQRVRRRAADAFAAAMSGFDAFVMPTAAVTACRADTDELTLAGPRMRNTMPFNVTGLPAISVPCGFDAETGMPVGLQVVGSAWSEMGILRVAGAFERATRWHQCRPDLTALSDR
jgi:aspartyl-tRNA(Asn)/glutamyl-tRNA(Gln) amidotransferase subunit A